MVSSRQEPWVLLTWVPAFTAVAVPLGQGRWAGHGVVEGLLHHVRHGPEVLPLLLLAGDMAGDAADGQPEARESECESHYERYVCVLLPAEVDHGGWIPSPCSGHRGRLTLMAAHNMSVDEERYHRHVW